MRDQIVGLNDLGLVGADEEVALIEFHKELIVGLRKVQEKVSYSSVRNDSRIWEIYFDIDDVLLEHCEVPQAGVYCYISVTS